MRKLIILYIMGALFACGAEESQLKDQGLILEDDSVILFYLQNDQVVIASCGKERVPQSRAECSKVIRKIPKKDFATQLHQKLTAVDPGPVLESGAKYEKAKGEYEQKYKSAEVRTQELLRLKDTTTSRLNRIEAAIKALIAAELSTTEANSVQSLLEGKLTQVADEVDRLKAILNKDDNLNELKTNYLDQLVAEIIEDFIGNENAFDIYIDPLNRDELFLHNVMLQFLIDFDVSSFKAEYFKNDEFVASEIVSRPSINTNDGAIYGINAGDFHAIWTGHITIRGAAQIIDVSFDLSWSDVILTIDGEIIESWSNSDKIIKQKLAVGRHDIKVEYFNNWHTVGFSSSFSSEGEQTLDQASHLVKKLMPEDALVIYVGAYEAKNKYNDVTVSLGMFTEPVFLVFSSYEALNWVIENKFNTKIVGVAVSSYGPTSQISGDHDFPIFRIKELSYAYKLEKFDEARKQVENLTGKEVFQFYGSYNLDTTKIEK